MNKCSFLYFEDSSSQFVVFSLLSVCSLGATCEHGSGIGAAVARSHSSRTGMGQDFFIYSVMGLIWERNILVGVGKGE